MLDTSVLVPRWSRVALQRLAVPPNDHYRSVWSEWIIAETWRVLTRKTVEQATRAGVPVDWPAVEANADAMMRWLLASMSTVALARRVDLPPAWPGHPDPNDLPIWHTARIAGAQYLVSHDLRGYPPRSGGRCIFDGVEYLTAIEFMEEVLEVSVSEVLVEPFRPEGVVRSGRRA